MFFAQTRVILQTLRFRLMLWNAVVMLVASLGALWGLREGVRYIMLSELDSDLQDDFGEVSLALVNVFEAENPFLHAQMDRKARGHIQRSWFVQFVDMTPDVPRVRMDRSRRRYDPRTSTSGPKTSAPPNVASPTPSGRESDTARESGTANAAPNATANATEKLVASIGNTADTGETPPAKSPPKVIWQTFNCPDWSLLDTPASFEQFVLPDGVPTTVDHYRVIEQNVNDARRGPVRVRMGASMKSIMHATDVSDRLFMFNVFISLVVAPLGGYWLALRATRPLNAMIHTTERLRPQQMEERLPIRNTSDEIDRLSASFNGLLDRIAEYISKRQDLLANSAHELRTPLAALRSTAELALVSERSVDEYRNLLESIVSECGNLELLVNQLLLLSESESAHFESRGEIVDFSTLTSNACEMFGVVAESRGIQLVTKIEPSAMVDGSRMHLRQLLNNLIDNAIKFIPSSGTVTVELNSAEKSYQLIVRDTGIGIDETEQKRLFERFYRGDRARRRNTPTKGTGLGLSICRAIAEAHGGTISVKSQIDVGTEFTVVLPKSHEVPPAAADPSRDGD